MKRLLPLVLLLAAFPSFGATCKISEYGLLGVDSAGRIVPVAIEPAITTQTVTYTTDTDSAAFNAATAFVRIVCDAKAHFVFGTGTITADADSPYVAADTPEYFGVRKGQSIKVSFYDGSS